MLPEFFDSAELWYDFYTCIPSSTDCWVYSNRETCDLSVLDAKNSLRGMCIYLRRQYVITCHTCSLVYFAWSSFSATDSLNCSSCSMPARASHALCAGQIARVYHLCEHAAGNLSAELPVKNQLVKLWLNFRCPSTYFMCRLDHMCVAPLWLFIGEFRCWVTSQNLVAKYSPFWIGCLLLQWPFEATLHVEPWERFQDPFHVYNLVDPASSYMLVSKIKPCMYKYKILDSELRMAH